MDKDHPDLHIMQIMWCLQPRAETICRHCSLLREPCISFWIEEGEEFAGCEEIVEKHFLAEM